MLYGIYRNIRPPLVTKGSLNDEFQSSPEVDAIQQWVQQIRNDAIVRVPRAPMVLQVVRRAAQETVGTGKAPWQGDVLRDGQTPPQPLRAAPPAFRLK